jgi:hypothetical protein
LVEHRVSHADKLTGRRLKRSVACPALSPYYALNPNTMTVQICIGDGGGRRMFHDDRV